MQKYKIQFVTYPIFVCSTNPCFVSDAILTSCYTDMLLFIRFHDIGLNVLPVH